MNDYGTKKKSKKLIKCEDKNKHDQKDQTFILKGLLINFDIALL